MPGTTTDTRLAIAITHADGTSDRWGPDEPDGQDIPADLTFSTSMPGGFKDMSCTLKRGLEVYVDEELFDDVFVHGPGGDPAWEGRMSHFPREAATVKPTAVGYVNHLSDDTTASEIYISRDLSKWQGPSASRIMALAGGNPPLRNVSQFQSAVQPDSNGQASLTFSGPAPLINHPIAEAWFDAGSANRIAAIRSPMIKPLGYLVFPDPNHYVAFFTSDDDVVTNYEIGFATIANPTSLTFTPTARYRYGVVQLFHDLVGPTGVDGWTYGWQFLNLSVIGGHGLTLRGSDIKTDGFWVSDIVENIVQRWAPLLNYTYPGSIEVDNFVVPHFAQHTATTGYNMLSLVNGFSLKDWGSYAGGYENYPRRTFFFREPDPTRLTWRARRSDGAVLTDEGVQAEELVNGVVVTYNTPDGVARTVGPPLSGCENTSTLLLDTDPENPVNAHNIPRKYGQITMSVTTTLAGATQVGAIWLQRRLGIQRRGSLTINGVVKNPYGLYQPAWKVRAGDYIIVEDDPRDSSPRKIINTTYSHSTRSNQCDLEHDAFRLDALMQRMGVELVGIV